MACTFKWQQQIRVIVVLALSWSLLLVGGAFQPAHAQSVSVSPTRVVFEGRDRSAEVLLQNHGEERVTYRLGLLRMRMSEEGRTEVIVDERDDELFADEYIRFSPRQVALDPGEVQRVRLMARKPADLKAGEYRAHLHFQVLPPAWKPPLEGVTNENDLSPSLRMLTSLTIPVIIRHGDLAADLQISSLAVLDAPSNTVAVSLARQGSRSVYGDLEVRYQPEGGQETVVAQMKGVAVYQPNALRRLHIPLSLPEGARLDGGRVKVTFKEDRKGRDRVNAGKVFAIPASP